MKLAFILDPLGAIKTYKDTSFAIMEEVSRSMLEKEGRRCPP